MSGAGAARRVRSAYLADPGARDRLRARWPALAYALDDLVASMEVGQESASPLTAGQLTEISDRWRRGPWGAAPGEGT